MLNRLIANRSPIKVSEIEIYEDNHGVYRGKKRFHFLKNWIEIEGYSNLQIAQTTLVPVF